MDQEATMLTLLEECGPSFRRIARAHAGADGEEEDLYQEILLQLWRALPSFRGDATLKTWSYRVALNTSLTWRRRAANHGKRRRRRPGGDAGEPSAAAPPGSQAAILTDFLETLGRLDHTVLLLYMEGLPHGEISEATGLSVGAVGVRIHRMKQTFLQRYVER